MAARSRNLALSGRWCVFLCTVELLLPGCKFALGALNNPGCPFEGLSGRVNGVNIARGSSWVPNSVSRSGPGEGKNCTNVFVAKTIPELMARSLLMRLEISSFIDRPAPDLDNVYNTPHMHRQNTPTPPANPGEKSFFPTRFANCRRN